MLRSKAEERTEIRRSWLHNIYYCKSQMISRVEGITEETAFTTHRRPWQTFASTPSFDVVVSCLKNETSWITTIRAEFQHQTNFEAERGLPPSSVPHPSFAQHPTNQLVNNPIGQRHLRLRSLLKSEIRADGSRDVSLLEKMKM
jgi:hypothetical protein